MYPMSACKFLIILSLLTGHRSTSQGDPEISISLESHDIRYSHDCPSVEGMVDRNDEMFIEANLTIYGLNSSLNATFGVSPKKDKIHPFIEEAKTSNCSQQSIDYNDFCVCTYLDNNEIHLRCEVMADCIFSGHLYFYMTYNNASYFTKSISIRQVYAMCESPLGPFSNCSIGLEKRTFTYPFNSSQARYSCRNGLLHGVDRFNMTGRVNTMIFSLYDAIVVEFGVLDRKDNTSITMLWPTIIIRLDGCSSSKQNANASCACLSREKDGYSVVCTFLASLEQSQMFGLFLVSSVQSGQYKGDAVRMPLVLDQCDETPKNFEKSNLLMYITLIIILVLVLGALLCVFWSKRCENAAHRGCSPKEQGEISHIQSNVDWGSSVDGPIKGTC